MTRPVFARGTGTSPMGPAGRDGTDGTDGLPGLPGVNAVANDTATAAYIGNPTSATATALSASFASFVNHGDDASYPRPVGASFVIWTGSVVPINAAPNDWYGIPFVQEFAPFELGISWHTAVWAEAESRPNGQVLTSIADQSGNGRNFTDIGSAPTFVTASTGLNGKKAYRFDGTDDYARTAAFTALALPATMIVVGKRTPEPSGGIYGLFGADNGGGSAGQVQGSDNGVHSLNNGADLVAGSRTDDLFVMVCVLNGSTSVFNLNGHVYSGTIGGATQPTKWVLARRTDQSWFAQIDIAFAGFMAGTPTDDQVAALLAGAANTYGIPTT